MEVKSRLSKQATVEEGWQCVLCAHFEPSVQPPAVCPECNCPKFRRVDSIQPRDRPTEESVAHFKKHVENCFNYSQDSNGKHFHKLELMWTIDKRKAYQKDPEKSWIVLEQVCKQCHHSYTLKHIPMTRVDVMQRLAKDDPQLRELLKEFIK
jgi:hypothetical protein